MSLLSDVPRLHDELAGLEGAFPRCLAGIDACLDAGLPVTLNPVFARQTQARAPEYVAFVARRFPRIRHISLSAVQPHGRARDGALLPDYAVLGPGIREARRRAEDAGITLLNPYCGLPICAGWDQALDQVVPTGDTGPGLDNHGNKSHGPVCGRCAYRPRCAGAWHAYWTVRGGSGLRAPLEKTPNWTGPRVQDQGPTRWQRMDHAWEAVEPGVTDVALRLDPADRKTLARLRRHRSNLNVTIGLDGPAEVDTLRLLEALGVERVVLRSQLPD